MSKIRAWSYSTLTNYETCPKQYWHYKVARDVREKKSTAADYGIEAHKAFEDRLIKGKSLPLDLQHHEKVLKPLADAPGQGMPEQKMALTVDLQPTGFFDDDVWCRAIADFAKVNGSRAILVDHKFGKMKEGFEQVEMQAAVLFAYLPDVEQITAGYYWAKAKRLPRKVLTRGDIPRIWNIFLPRVSKFEEAHKRDEFPARRNGLCRRYCAVTSCPHHGG